MVSETETIAPGSVELRVLVRVDVKKNDRFANVATRKLAGLSPRSRCRRFFFLSFFFFFFFKCHAKKIGDGTDGQSFATNSFFLVNTKAELGFSGKQAIAWASLNR